MTEQPHPADTPEPAPGADTQTAADLLDQLAATLGISSSGGAAGIVSYVRRLYESRDGSYSGYMALWRRAQDTEAAIARVWDLRDQLAASDALAGDTITRAEAARLLATALDGVRPVGVQPITPAGG